MRDENIFCQLKKKGVKADSEVSGLGEWKDEDGINQKEQVQGGSSGTFGNAKLEMFFRPPSCDIVQVIGYMTLELRGEAQVHDKYWELSAQQ